MERSGPFCALLLLVLVGSGWAQFRHPLPVLWLVDRNSSVDLAVRLALRDLAEQPAPLGNYEIQLHEVESECESSLVLKSLFDTLWAGPKYLLVLGRACPSVARALPALHLLQISFTSAAPYRNLFSIAHSPRAVGQATAELLLYHNWTRVGLVSQRGLAEMKRDLIGRLMEVKVEVVAMELSSFDVCSSLRKMKAADVRIFISLLDQDSTSDVFCCAYRLNLFGPRYQWVVAGPESGPVAVPRPGRRWRPGGSGCWSDSIKTAADGSIRLHTQKMGDPNTPSDSGRTPQDFLAAFARSNQDRSKVSPLHGYAYDGMWAAAKALSQVTEAVKRREKLSRKVSEDDVEKLLLEAVKQTQFQGVTGPVIFRHGQRTTTVQLVQYQGNGEVTVGWFRTDNQQLQLLAHRLKFKGSGPAKDQPLVRQERRGVSLLLYIIMSSVAGVTIFLTLIVLLYITFRHKLWLSRWRSSSQDWLLLLGLLLSSSSVLVSGLDHVSLLDQTAALLCSARQWTLSVGHTVSVSVLLCRTWKFSSLVGVSEQQQNLLVLFLFLLDVLVLSSWQVTDPLRRVEMQHDVEYDPVEPDVLVRPVSDLCTCNNTHLWRFTVYVSRGPLLSLGCFLAWCTRTSPTAPEQTYLSLCMFAVTVFAVIGASTSLLMVQSPSLHFCLTSSLVLCCNITVLMLMFGAKLVALWSNDWDEPSEGDDKDDYMSIFNWQLKSRVATLDLEIRSIMTQLSEQQQQCSSGSGVEGLQCVTHVAQIYAPNMKPGNINSPELVRRRLSVQLPILHHSYLPAVGGVSASSSSSQFGSREAFIYDHFLYT